MKEEQLLAILAAILSVGHAQEPEDLFQNAPYLMNTPRRYLEESKRTTRLKAEFAAVTGNTLVAQ